MKPASVGSLAFRRISSWRPELLDGHVTLEVECLDRFDGRRRDHLDSLQTRAADALRGRRERTERHFVGECQTPRVMLEQQRSTVEMHGPCLCARRSARRAWRRTVRSDLAALRTEARLEDGHFMVNGQKVWISHGWAADWCELVVRTNPDVEVQPQLMP